MPFTVAASPLITSVRWISIELSSILLLHEWWRWWDHQRMRHRSSVGWQSRTLFLAPIWAFIIGQTHTGLCWMRFRRRNSIRRHQSVDDVKVSNLSIYLSLSQSVRQSMNPPVLDGRGRRDLASDANAITFSLCLDSVAVVPLIAPRRQNRTSSCSLWTTLNVISIDGASNMFRCTRKGEEIERFRVWRLIIALARARLWTYEISFSLCDTQPIGWCWTTNQCPSD